MKKIVLAVIIFMGLLGPTRAAGPEGTELTLSVERAIEMALKYYPSVKQAASDRDAASARLSQKYAAFWPALDMEASFARLEPDPPFYFPGMGSFQLYPENNYDMHVGFRYTLFDLGRTGSLIDLSKEMLVQSENALELSKSLISYQTVQLFYSVIFLSRQVDVSQKEIDSLTEYMEQTRNKVKFGSATDYDALTIQVKVEEAKNAKADFENSYNKTLLQLKKNIGFDGKVKLAGKFPQEAVEIEESTFIEKALKQRAEYLMAKKSEDIAKAQLLVAENSDNPSLGIGGTWGFKNGYLPVLSDLQNNWVFSAGLKVPLFDGFRTVNMEAEAKAALSSAEYKVKDVKETVSTEIKQSVSDVKTGFEKLNAADLHVKLAEEAMAQAKVRFDNGVITNLDLINAETSLARARLFYSQAQYAYVMSVYSLKRAMGVKIW